MVYPVYIGSQNIEVSTLSKQFGREDVTVTLLLTEFDSLYLYHVSAIPQLISQTFIESTMVQVGVSYNIHYNVSIIAASPCGKNNVTKFIEVYFGEIFLTLA
jgi:hypothetical protein